MIPKLEIYRQHNPPLNPQTLVHHGGHRRALPAGWPRNHPAGGAAVCPPLP